MDQSTKRAYVKDILFLWLGVFTSALPYISKIGFYSDDWSYQATLLQFADRGIIAMFRGLWALDVSLRIRPVQLAYLVLGFEVFGSHPLAYHVFNSAMLGLTVALLYLTLRELQAGRWLAFTIALVFGFLPHYSSVRFWISSHQVTLSMALAYAGIYAASRAARCEPRFSWKWTVSAVLALSLSILAYETGIGIIAAALILIWVRTYIHKRSTSMSTLRSAIVWPVFISGAALMAVGAIKSAHQTRLQFHFALFLVVLGDLSKHKLAQALEFNFGIYFLNLPSVLASFYRHSAIGPGPLTIASLTTLAVAIYIWREPELSVIPSASKCFALVGAGFLVFGLGYLLFISNFYTDFNVMGLNNRLTMFSALGPACVWVGVAGMAYSALKPASTRSIFHAITIALICGVNCLVVNGIAVFWEDARARQSEVIAQVSSELKSLAPRSIVLLDGFCRYSGPAVVFEAPWDATGLLRIALRDSTLTGDVVAPRLHFDNDGVNSYIYGSLRTRYDYGSNLFLYNLQQRKLLVVSSVKDARAYVSSTNPSQNGDCPPALEGRGATLF